MSPDRLKIGILGAGMIATAPYGVLPNLAALADRVQVVAIAAPGERAVAVAAAFGIPSVFASLEAMLDGATLDAVVNLTPIPLHYQTSRTILAAGKHLVTEKPLAGTLAEADELCAMADASDLLIVSAPVDMLGHDWQQARRLIATGAIGRPAFARVQSSHGGPALLAWPSDPSCFYAKGAGPLLDLGVYGLHRITGLLGPARRVSAFSGITAPLRHARGGPFHGKDIPVEETDNTLMLLDFGNAVFASVDATYNVVATRSPLVEVYGSEGTLLVHAAAPALELFRLDAAPGLPGWITPAPVGFPPPPDPVATLQRGLLVAHLADCLATGSRPVLSAEHARHVLEIMLAARESARNGSAVTLTTSFAMPPVAA
ncbi:Gfo/Idh/MocA family protein [Polymorphobacter sp.]|uniref:Gfo/Idh/MocA family protein n=1 Tax=Polymorphobacter sp. TaxID=1909290 RepID=UPI003F7165F2